MFSVKSPAWGAAPRFRSTSTPATRRRGPNHLLEVEGTPFSARQPDREHLPGVDNFAYSHAVRNSSTSAASFASSFGADPMTCLPVA
jgi:hypothetical protein